MEMARERERERRMDGWMLRAGAGCWGRAAAARRRRRAWERERERGERERGVGIGRGALKEIAPSPPLALRARGERVVLTKVPCYISFPPAAGCWLLAAAFFPLPLFLLGCPPRLTYLPPTLAVTPPRSTPPPRPALVEKIENRRNPRENHFSFSQQHTRATSRS